MATGMELLTALANSIRSKTGRTGNLTLAQMKTAVDGIIVPSGSISITANGSHNVTNYATASVSVPASAVTSGTKSITTNGSHDVTTYKTANVNVGIPSGYIKPSGTKSITTNGNHDVAAYATANVNVGIPSGYIKPIGNINITSTSSFDVTNYATAIVSDSDLIASNIKKGVNILGVVGTYDADPISINTVPITVYASGKLYGTSLWSNVTINTLSVSSTQAVFAYTVTAGTQTNLGFAGSGIKYTVDITISGTGLTSKTTSIVVKQSQNDNWEEGTTEARFEQSGTITVTVTGTPTIATIANKFKSSEGSTTFSKSGTLNLYV